MTISVERPDHYRILEVDPHAAYEVIRAAHRALAAKHHPDVAGRESDMAALNVARTVLSDPVEVAEVLGGPRQTTATVERSARHGWFRHH
jgi:curved DNA-binding protein CbpA